MRKLDFPRCVFAWLTGISTLFAATILRAQQPELGPPPGGEAGHAGLSIGTGQGVLGEGDRAPKLEAGFTAPGPTRLAQLFISTVLPAGVHTYSITQAAGGPKRTTIKLDPSADVTLVGEFKAVDPPQKERDEDAFPGLVLETHSGTVKWVASIQLAAKPGPKRSRFRAR